MHSGLLWIGYTLILNTEILWRWSRNLKSLSVCFFIEVDRYLFSHPDCRYHFDIAADIGGLAYEYSFLHKLLVYATSLH